VPRDEAESERGRKEDKTEEKMEKGWGEEAGKVGGEERARR
jgi:hypothetical protein